MYKNQQNFGVFFQYLKFTRLFSTLMRFTRKMKLIKLKTFLINS